MKNSTFSRGIEALPRPTKGERKRISVAEFVAARFAAFDRIYGLATLDESRNPNGGVIEENKVTNIKTSSKKSTHKIGADDLESDEADEADEADDACVTLIYFTLLTSLYLPLLLFLWIRRNVYGAGSLVRSLFLGHILRLVLAFLLLPPSTTKTLVPKCVWNAAMSMSTRAENLWTDKRVQAIIPGWFHLCLAILLGVNDGSHMSFGGVSILDFPPSLTALAIFTLLVFVVHPDGLTWIMLGRMREAFRSALRRKSNVICMIKDGSINLTPIEISGTIAGMFIFYTVMRGITPPPPKSPPSPHREKIRHKHKKGKKGRGGKNHHGNSGGGKGRIRGGHYRSVREMYESSARASSRSQSPSNTQRCDSDMEDTTVSATSEMNVPSFDGSKKELHLKSKVEHCRLENTEAKVTAFSSPLESRVENENSSSSSLATHRSNLPSTQEGGKQVHKKGRGKNEKSAPTSLFSSHQVQPKEKKLVIERGPTKPESADTTFVLGNSQSNQCALPHNYRKKKHRSRRKKSKASNKYEKPGFQGHSSSSFFSSTATTFQQQSNYTERRTALTAPEPSRPQGNPKILRDRVIGKRSSVQTVQLQETSSLSLSQSVCLEEGHSTSNSLSQPELNVMNTLPNYNLPNYKNAYSYSSIDRRYGPGKQELAAFFVEVQLTGTACKEFLETIEDVDALEKLTDSDYVRYDIDIVKRAEVQALLEARRRRHIFEGISNQKEQNPWNTEVAPPPGLVPTFDSAVTASEALSNSHFRKGQDQQQLQSVSSVTLPLDAGSSCAFASSSTLDVFQCRTDTISRNTSTATQSSDYRIRIPSSCNTVAFPTWDNEDEKIEAHLQELGGQMAGSILDF